MDKQTIVASITGSGQAAVHIVRLSGEQTRDILKSTLEDAEAVFEKPRTLLLQTIKDISRNDRPLDKALVSFFPSPNSFTGEDCAELNLHGSPFLVSRVLENICQLGGRIANAGEFTQRAFLNGRIDLAQAEAVSDLIAAETEAQARVAQEQLAGKLSGAIMQLGEPLRDTLAEIEAYIDFPEEDIDTRSRDGWQQKLETTLQALDTYLKSYHSGRICREGANVVLLGKPNAGKSSLLNTLVGMERAIVTPIPGTTRDSIEERISLGGLFIKLWDTAGLVEEQSAQARDVDLVERLGVERSWKKLREADLAVFLFDGEAELEDQIVFFKEVEKKSSEPVLALLNKMDVLGEAGVEKMARELGEKLDKEVLSISAKSGSGIDDLTQRMLQILNASGAQEDSVLICSSRHRDALAKARENIASGIELVAQSQPSELAALEIRSGLGALDEIVGVTHTEDILGRIFSKFCIGK